MYIVYPLVIFIALSVAVTDFTEGRSGGALGGLAVAAVSGFLLWRSLRNPEAVRKRGEYAKITFMPEPGPGVQKKGCFARVDSLRKVSWNVALDRPPQPGDLDSHGIAHGGWVWHDATGLPQRIRIDFGTTWASWDVHSAAVAES